MRLLVITETMDRTEAALYAGLMAGGVHVEILCDPSGHRQEAVRNAGVPISHLSIRHRLDRAAVRTLRQRITRESCDVVYAPCNKSLSVSLLARRDRRVKIVGYRGTTGHLSRWDPASWLTYLNPRLDRIVCVSEAVRRYLLSMGIPALRLVTIPKGHDVAWYDGGAPADLSEFGIPPSAFVAGFTGNMRPVKGVGVLLRAALLLPPSPPVHFLMVGDVRDRSIRRLAMDERLRRVVHWAGYRPDAARLAGRCHVFVMPSLRREGLPRSVVEAMAQSVPVIVSDVGGLPELVVHGASGLVVPPRDPAALAEAILRFAQDPSRGKVMGQQARRRIETHFNITDTIRHHHDMCEQLLREP